MSGVIRNPRFLAEVAVHIGYNFADGDGIFLDERGGQLLSKFVLPLWLSSDGDDGHATPATAHIVTVNRKLQRSSWDPLGRRTPEINPTAVSEWRRWMFPFQKRLTSPRRFTLGYRATCWQECVMIRLSSAFNGIRQVACSIPKPAIKTKLFIASWTHHCPRRHTFPSLL